MFGATLDVIATGAIMGLGAQGYVRAVDAGGDAADGRHAAGVERCCSEADHGRSLTLPSHARRSCRAGITQQALLT
jgi:hypothetical protein